MLQITSTKTALILKAKEGTIRVQYNKGSFETHTDVQNNSNIILRMTKKIKNYLRNFHDPKRDYAKRINECAKQLQTIAGNGNTLSYIERKFQAE